MGRHSSFYACLAFLLCALACGCETVKGVYDRMFSSDQRAEEESIAATYWDGPRVRPGIALSIQVAASAAQPVTMHCLVDQKGEIVCPHLLQEPVACEGLSLEALKEKLVKAYSVYYRQPQVTVTFAPYDANTGVSPWGTITVLGEVARPGPVNMPATMDMTVTKALLAVGGCKPFANKSKVRVTRCDRDGKQKRTIVNINEIGEEGRPDKDMVLRPGDVVWVPEAYW